MSLMYAITAPVSPSMWTLGVIIVCCTALGVAGTAMLKVKQYNERVIVVVPLTMPYKDILMI